ncbi:SGNH/GDSL hydrolase family protein [Candidatus Uabimicrobium amorphum]|uniref:SGNH hydrolase-type esterase domain-containing protein n=1 Tax=Uabimicrobium amorphum TaxID=2596890 RepID=A0A5S9IPE1_UABAM|nr:SGNH/GDSL hydrolase family protein [Candidatus Uabimicrobium amorphum]BBM85643.1 hypothetical protein UABAM_04017 [Candidatus Uabimicrobium amorphum]
MSKNKKILVLAMSSIVFFILLLEISLRVVLGFPIENKVDHPILGHTIRLSYPSIDADGFRNPKVLKQADIVTIGDSHTYGQNATSLDTWPQQLGKLTNQTVYNLGIGGYGILQYYYLLDRAIEMKPKTIVVGLLFTNDFSDILQMVTRSEHWQKWCKKNKEPILQVMSSNDTKKYKKKKSSWIKHTAVSYLFDDIIRPNILRKIFPKKEKAFVTKDEKNTKKFKYKRLKAVAQYMDLKRPAIKEAYLLAKKLLLKMKQKCDEKNIRFVVLMIPTAEYVFHDYLIERKYSLPEKYQELVSNEKVIVNDISSYFEKNGIEHVTILNELKHALETTGKLYPTEGDAHPVAAGYEVYARGVYEKFFKK